MGWLVEAYQKLTAPLPKCQQGDVQVDAIRAKAREDCRALDRVIDELSKVLGAKDAELR